MIILSLIVNNILSTLFYIHSAMLSKDQYSVVAKCLMHIAPYVGECFGDTIHIVSRGQDLHIIYLLPDRSDVFRGLGRGKAEPPEPLGRIPRSESDGARARAQGHAGSSEFGGSRPLRTSSRATHVRVAGERFPGDVWRWLPRRAGPEGARPPVIRLVRGAPRVAAPRTVPR